MHPNEVPGPDPARPTDDSVSEQRPEDRQDHQATRADTAERAGRADGAERADRGLRPIQAHGVQWTPVSEKLITVNLVGGGVGWLIWLAITTVPLVLRLIGVWSGYPAWLAWGVPLAFLVWAVIDLALVPRRVRALGYAEREDDLLLRSGLLFRQITAVPYGRLQYLDVSEGPLRRAFGIRSLGIKTAAADTDATLEGIVPEEADRLREELTARGQARLAGL